VKSKQRRRGRDKELRGRRAKTRVAGRKREVGGSLGNKREKGRGLSRRCWDSASKAGRAKPRPSKTRRRRRGGEVRERVGQRRMEVVEGEGRSVRWGSKKLKGMKVERERKQKRGGEGVYRSGGWGRRARDLGVGLSESATQQQQQQSAQVFASQVGEKKQSGRMSERRRCKNRGVMPSGRSGGVLGRASGRRPYVRVCEARGNGEKKGPLSGSKERRVEGEVANKVEGRGGAVLGVGRVLSGNGVGSKKGVQWRLVDGRSSTAKAEVGEDRASSEASRVTTEAKRAVGGSRRALVGQRRKESTEVGSVSNEEMRRGEKGAVLGGRRRKMQRKRRERGPVAKGE
jgi:hypothetical protein